MNNIYKLGLNETIKAGEYEITRVPGGWIYRPFSSQVHTVPVFIPFNNEFEIMEMKK